MAKKQNSLPNISIVIPSYNKADYIKATLTSIVKQNYPNLEVIIQDGGSTDGTVDIIKEFSRKYPHIFQWVSQKDDGQVDAINQGLRKVKGDIVTYLNADDVYAPQALISVGEYFQQNSCTLWLTGYGDIIDSTGKTFYSWVTLYKNFFLIINQYWLLLIVNYITQPATFISKKGYQDYGPFTGTKKYVMEYELWLKLGRVKMPLVLKKNLASFRLTMDNISATSFTELLSLDYKIITKYTKNLMILFFHYLHNLARIKVISLLNKR